MIALVAEVAHASMEVPIVEASWAADVGSRATIEAPLGGPVTIAGELVTPAVLATVIDTD